MKTWTRPAARRFNAASITLTTQAPLLPPGWSIEPVPCPANTQQTCYIICHS